MKLLTERIKELVPNLGDQEGKGNEAIVYAKFFDPCGRLTWYLMELDPVSGQAFGYVSGGYNDELGYFSIKELEALKNRYGLGVERDTWFAPKTLGAVKNKISGGLPI